MHVFMVNGDPASAVSVSQTVGAKGDDLRRIHVSHVERPTSDARAGLSVLPPILSHANNRARLARDLFPRDGVLPPVPHSPIDLTLTIDQHTPSQGEAW